MAPFFRPYAQCPWFSRTDGLERTEQYQSSDSAGMRERAPKIDGLLKISSSATDGTEVQLSVPGGVAFERSFLNTALTSFCLESQKSA